MKQAIRLARKGSGQVSPNPLVGAVVVNGDKKVGESWHRFFGGAHAEINALEKAGELAKQADIYVNLEPCCHYGKTPPCTDALIKAGIRRVFVGMVDPNPAVAGKGIKRLEKAGIKVETGLLENECKKLNEFFIKFVTKKVPFVILKTALTLDGKIATHTGDSKWITCESSREKVHRIRSEVDAVMVGIGTVLYDDPLLTVRLRKKNSLNPLKIIVDSSLRIPLESKVLKPGFADKTIIATSPGRAASKKALAISNTGAQIFKVPLKKKRVDLTKLVELAGRHGISSILIEGGSELGASALESKIVDKTMFFYAPKIIGGTEAKVAVGGRGIKNIADAIQIEDIRISRIKSDFLIEGYIRTN